MSGMTSPFLSGFATEWLGGSSGEATSRREGGTLHRAQGLGMWPGILVDGQPDGYHIKFDTYTPTYLPYLTYPTYPTYLLYLTYSTLPLPYLLYPTPTLPTPTLPFPSLAYPTLPYIDTWMQRCIDT